MVVDYVYKSTMETKKGMTVDAELPTAPTNPGLYTGNTNSLKSTYKQKLKLYEQHEEHRRNSNKAIQSCFDPDLLIDLETDGLLLGVTPMEVFQHMCDSFLQKVDKDREMLETRELLKVQYDPDRIL